MLEFESNIDGQPASLEHEWRRGYEASIVARAEYQALSADRRANADALDAARERLDRAEAAMFALMTRLERFEAG